MVGIIITQIIEENISLHIIEVEIISRIPHLLILLIEVGQINHPKLQLVELILQDITVHPQYVGRLQRLEAHLQLEQPVIHKELILKEKTNIYK
jgi:hypothetical protein